MRAAWIAGLLGAGLAMGQPITVLQGRETKLEKNAPLSDGSKEKPRLPPIASLDVHRQTRL